MLIEILPSDIVGFTAMAAQSSPMQVVTLSFFHHQKMFQHGQQIFSRIYLTNVFRLLIFLMTSTHALIQ